MINVHWLLYLFAFVCFVIAAVPHKINLRFEWLAFSLLTLTRIL